MSKVLSILLILLAIIAITYGRSTGFNTDQGLKFSNEAKVYERKDESGFEAALHLNIDLNSNSEDDNTDEDNTDEDNTGEDCTGEGNTGEGNTGEDNTGEDNSGEDNTDEDNTGEDNTGEDNTGEGNTGEGNTGTSTGEGNTQGGRCDYYWTKFYNRDHPSATGDWELLSNLRSENRGEICETPIAVEAQLVDGRPAAASGNIITISPTVGLICKNIDQGKGSGVHCNNFKVRFLCLNQTVSGKNTVGIITVGKHTVGKITVGKHTVGKNTVGKHTTGKSTVGKITVGKISVGKHTVGLGKARATDV